MTPRNDLDHHDDEDSFARATAEALREPLLSNDNHRDCEAGREEVNRDVSPSACDAAPSDKVSRNVWLVLAYTFFAFGGRSIWNQSVLAAFVYILKGNDPAAVGYVTAVMGAVQLLCSFPTGYLADSYRRDWLLKCASVVGIVAILCSSLALWTLDFSHLVAALAVWGACWGIANTALGALFADSIPKGQRSYYFTHRSMLITTGSTFGPIISLVMFALLGDQWTVRDCAIVMFAGQLVCFPGVILLCFMNDDDAVEKNDTDAPTDQQQEGGDEERRISDVIEGEAEAESEPQRWCCFSATRKIPILIAMGDVITGFGSGMSIRYFPIFFVEYLKLSPVLVQVLYIVAPVCQAIMMRITQRLSRRYGRCHVSAMVKWTGVAIMYSMVLAYVLGVSTWVVCVIYVVRTAVMNSTSALTRSVLMDNIPQRERARWAAAESINMFSWSGSAAIGGLLVSKIGLLWLFVITGSLQLSSTIPLVTLFRHDVTEAVEDDDQQDEGAASEEDEPGSASDEVEENEE